MQNSRAAAMNADNRYSNVSSIRVQEEMAPGWTVLTGTGKGK